LPKPKGRWRAGRREIPCEGSLAVDFEAVHMTVWLVQYRDEKERSLEQRLQPGLLEMWRINPYAPERITREAQEDDLVVIWRAKEKTKPAHRQRNGGGIVGWGRLRLAPRLQKQPNIYFEVTHAFPKSPIPRNQVLADLGKHGLSSGQWPGPVSLKRLNGPEEQVIRRFFPMAKENGTSWHPLQSGYPPSWASGWGQDEYGVFAEITVETITQRLRWCPQGAFRMGSPTTEHGRVEVEGPQVQVNFATGFWLFDTPVSKALYQSIIGIDPAGPEDQDHPVTSVSWKDAGEFLSKLNGRIPGLNLRMPSEAEWEYACRAGSDTPFEPNVARQFSGQNTTSEEVNYDGDYPYKGTQKGIYRKKTVPTKGDGFRPNKWGLWHMHGNVWEWCADIWSNSHDGAATDGSARQASQQADESVRVLRGGSWGDLAGDCRSASRLRLAPDYRYDTIGFRPARGQQGAQAGAAEPPSGSSGQGV